MNGNTTELTPTTIWDWISPSLGDSLGLSPNRAVRTAQIFNNFGCSEARTPIDSLFIAGATFDREDFERVLDGGQGYNQISYLTPGPFHYYSSEYGLNNGPTIFSGSSERYLVGFEDPATTPRSYKPQLTRVGTQVSNKILAADGTRYLTDDLILDFDTNPTTAFYSSFGTSGPIFEESRAYGRNTIPDSTLNVDLSMRHAESVNALYFDGHVESLSKSEMYTDPNPWFPTGSVFSFNRATPESVTFMEAQQGNRNVAKIY